MSCQNFHLEGKLGIVTGGTGGIGRAISLGLMIGTVIIPSSKISGISMR
jgi:hypothetical protein